LLEYFLRGTFSQARIVAAGKRGRVPRALTTFAAGAMKGKVDW
jgi:hypothetical protein